MSRPRAFVGFVGRLPPVAREINSQRAVALSAGTLEFWAVDPKTRTVQISDSNGLRKYTADVAVPIAMFGNATIQADQLFEI